MNYIVVQLCNVADSRIRIKPLTFLFEKVVILFEKVVILFEKVSFCLRRLLWSDVFVVSS
jgi:hypothetical protein